VERAGIAAAGAVAVASLALSFTHLASPDLGFHLATGRAVLALGGIPAENLLSFTEPHHPWILHEWLPAVIFELAWRGRGVAGVLAVKIVIVVATWSLVIGVARRLGASPVPAGIVSLLGAWAAASRFNERPQIFSNLALAGCAFLLAGAAASSPGPSRGRRVAAAGLLAAVAAQVHAGAVTSFTLLVAVAAGTALEPWRARLLRDEVRSPAGVGAVAAALRVAAVAAVGVAVAAALLLAYHPHGARPLLVPFQLAADADLHEHVVEFRPPSAFGLAVYPYWTFAALSAALVIGRARRLPASLLVPYVVFAALSLRHVRVADSFAIVAAPIGAKALDDLLGERGAAPKTRALGLALMGALTAALPLDHFRTHAPGVGVVEAVWPESTLRFFEREHLVGPAFLSDGWAGPYLGAFSPRERVYFDPRFEAYSPSFVREGYRAVLYGEPGCEEQLDRYGVELVALKYTSAGERRFEGGKENLRQILARSPRWALVGFGDAGEVFVRVAGPNGPAAARLAIPGVDPDRAAFLGPPAASAPGLLRAVDAGFQDSRTLALAAFSAAAAGKPALAADLLGRAESRRPGDPLVAAVRDALSGRGPGTASGAPDASP
jgi:hypothetical protein